MHHKDILVSVFPMNSSSGSKSLSYLSLLPSCPCVARWLQYWEYQELCYNELKTSLQLVTMSGPQPWPCPFPPYFLLLKRCTDALVQSVSSFRVQCHGQGHFGGCWWNHLLWLGSYLWLSGYKFVFLLTKPPCCSFLQYPMGLLLLCEQCSILPIVVIGHIKSVYLDI